MKPVRIVQGTAVPLDRSDVDTDQIIPAEWLKRVERTGFEKGLFATWRDDRDFVLNDERYARASIIVAGPAFGVGSSREHAVWAIQQAGFDAVVAPSFSDIFRNNCTKNGMLPVVLTSEQCREIAHRGKARVDLEAQTVDEFPFEIEPEVKHRLLNGLDDISVTLQQEDRIAAYEQERERVGPVTTSL